MKKDMLPSITVVALTALFVLGPSGSAFAQKPGRGSSHPRSPSTPDVGVIEPKPRQARERAFASDHFIVKFKSEGAHALKQPAHELINGGKSFAAALRDGTAALDNLNSEVNVLEARSLFRKQARRIKGKEVIFNTAIFYVPEGRDIEDICRRYSELPSVEYAEPDYVVQADAEVHPLDAYYAGHYLWGLYNDGGGAYSTDAGDWVPSTEHADIDAPNAWGESRGNGVLVAVVDTGADYNHEDLVDNMWVNAAEETGTTGVDDDENGYIDDIFGYDFNTCVVFQQSPPYDCITTKSRDADPMDAHFHGTHVSGTIAAMGSFPGEGGTELGVVGVAPEATILPVKGLNDTDGRGWNSDLAAAIEYAIDMGADVINNSWAGGGYSAALEDIIETAFASGVVVVFSAGNDDEEIQSDTPAGMYETIAAGASDWNDARWVSDPLYASNWGALLDVSVPGVDTLSAYPEPDLAGEDWTYCFARGTSMGAAHVSGIAALLLAQDPDITNEQIKHTIRNSADDIGDSGPDIYAGYGRADAYQALTRGWSGPAKITSISNGAVLDPTGGSVDIIGTADGTHYELFYRAYDASGLGTSLTGLVSGSVMSSTLYSWDISSMPSGKYILRLQVTRSDGWDYEDIIHFSIADTVPSISFSGLALLAGLMLSSVAWARRCS